MGTPIALPQTHDAGAHSKHPGLLLARVIYGAVAVVLALAFFVRLKDGGLDLSVMFFAMLVLYPIGFAVGVTRLRPMWRGGRLSWHSALPLLVHAIAGLWGALGLASVALTGPAVDGLGAALEVGLLPAGVALAAGWLLVLGIATRVEGTGPLLLVALLVPFTLWLWLAYLGAGR